MRVIRARANNATAVAAAAAAHVGRGPATAARVGAALLGLGVASLLMVDGSRAAFSGTTDNGGNTVTAGTVTLTDDDDNATMFDISGLNGGQSVPQKCIKVTYTGDLISDVKLHGAVAGDLAAGLTTRIEVGTGATGGSTFDCTGFTPGSTSFDGTLSAFGDTHGTYAKGLVGFDGATKGTTRSYRITLTVVDDNVYQGKNATVKFTWEAQGRNNA